VRKVAGGLRTKVRMNILVFQFRWLLLKCKRMHLDCLCLPLEAMLERHDICAYPTQRESSKCHSFVHPSFMCTLCPWVPLIFTSHYAILQFVRCPPILRLSESASNEFRLGILAQTMPCVYNVMACESYWTAVPMLWSGRL
jgi:hypothetical protein